MRILYVTNYLSPYRIDWMNMLSIENDVFAYYELCHVQTREDEWLNYKKPVFFAEEIPRNRIIKSLPSGRFINLIDNNDYDIYIIDGYSSIIKLIIIRKLLSLQKRVFINVDGIDIWKKKSLTSRLKNCAKRIVFNSGASFLCGSMTAEKTILEMGADKTRVFVHPFTSLEQEDIIEVQQKYRLQKEYKKRLNLEQNKVVLAVGRFIPLKRYDCLIEAWKDMPQDCFLYLIGGGPERENYEKLIAKNRISNIKLLDFVLPDRLNDYYIAADLFVHPSSTEVWGLVINEAMAKGCPVISTNRCIGAVEMIRDGVEGYLTEVGDVQGLHDAMLTVLSDDILEHNMMQNAIERIRYYTLEKMVEIHNNVFRKQFGE